MAVNGDRKPTGSNLGCTLRCGFSCQSFSQSSSDHKRLRRKYRSRLLKGQYESRPVKKFIRFLRYITNKILPIEREADMFAMSWLVQREGGKVLLEFLDRHPEKKWLFRFILVHSLVRLPFRLVKTLFGKLLLAQAKS
jgi:hypothetical protein